MITLRNVTGGYTKQTAIVRELSFTVDQGDFFALLGPNGSGKTTIIRLIMGALSLHSGEIMIDGKNVTHYKAKELAKKVAVMTQENEIGLDFTVREIVNLGRYPHQSSILFKENNEHDEMVVDRVMKQTNVWYMKDQPFSSLSGGEKQRVLLAKALAQEPSILLLDEPTNHLDVRHTIELLDLLKQLQLTNQLTILAILHDLNIASLYADQIGLLCCGDLQGTYDSFNKQDEQSFSSVYGVDMHFQAHPKLAKNQVFVLPQYPDEPAGGPVATIQRDREGFQLQVSEPMRTLSVGANGKGITWENEWHIRKFQLNDCCNQQQTLVGTAKIYAYDANYDECFSVHPDELEKTNWHVLLLFCPNNDALYISMIAKMQLSDVDLMNLSLQITSLKTKLELEFHQQTKSLELLTVSVLSDVASDESHKKTAQMLLPLFQFAWEIDRVQSKV
ncbi:MAG: ABC transporter ATP-binding protein [Bacillus sp. (in: firmicutes)]